MRLDSLETVRLLQARKQIVLQTSIGVPHETRPIWHDLRPILDTPREGNYVWASQDLKVDAMDALRQ
jgi:hypothetical protein